MPQPTNFVNNVGMVYDADAINGAHASINAGVYSGPYASMPAAAAGYTGAHYFCTDTDSVYKCNGSAWTKVRMGSVPAGPPIADVSASLTALNIGSGSVASDRGDRLLTIPSVAGDNVRGEYGSLTPGSGYTLTACVDVTGVVASPIFMSGILLRDSGGKLIIYGTALASGATQFQSYVFGFNSATSANAVISQTLIRPFKEQLPQWLRIREDSTIRYYEYTYDGLTWDLSFSHAKTSFLTANGCGYGAYNTSGVTAKVRARSLVISNP